MQQNYFSGDNCVVPCALATRRVPPTTANGRIKLDKNGIAKRKDSIAPNPVHAYIWYQRNSAPCLIPMFLLVCG